MPTFQFIRFILYKIMRTASLFRNVRMEMFMNFISFGFWGNEKSRTSVQHYL